MTVLDGNLCLAAFSNLCDEIDDSSIIGSEECQYWLFECGYKAALESLTASTALVATKTHTARERAETALH